MYRCKKYLLFDLGNIIIVGILYLLNNGIFKELEFIDIKLKFFLVCYFNDLICPFGFLSYLNVLFRILNYRIRRVWEIWLWCLCSGFIWEYFAPLLKPSGISDPCDLLCYLIGGTGYYLLGCVLFDFKLNLKLLKLLKCGGYCK